MKLLVLTIFGIIILIASASAGDKRINLYGGYVFDDKFDSYIDPYNYYNGKIKGGFQYGLCLEFNLPPYNAAELIYIGQQTTAPTYYYPNGAVTSPDIKEKILDLNFNYALGGFTRYFTKDDSKVEPYLTAMLGALFANAHDNENGESRDAVKFTWGFKLGTNFWISDKFGIKLQGMLLSTTQTAGGTLYFGSGGNGPGTTTASSMLQLSVSTGVVYKFSKKSEE